MKKLITTLLAFLLSFGSGWTVYALLKVAKKYEKEIVRTPEEKEKIRRWRPFARKDHYKEREVKEKPPTRSLVLGRRPSMKEVLGPLLKPSQWDQFLKWNTEQLIKKQRKQSEEEEISAIQSELGVSRANAELRYKIRKTKQCETERTTEKEYRKAIDKDTRLYDKDGKYDVSDVMAKGKLDRKIKGYTKISSYFRKQAIQSLLKEGKEEDKITEEMIRGALSKLGKLRDYEIAEQRAQELLKVKLAMEKLPEELIRVKDEIAKTVEKRNILYTSY